MGRNLLMIILIAIIVTLLVPITATFYASEQAFTPDNFIRMETQYN